MKNSVEKLFFISCMLCFFSCSAQKQPFDSLSPVDFEKLITEKPDIQLVDVRRPDEFEAGHIAKAVLINVQDSDFITKAKSLLDKSKPVAVYCRSGRRSKEAAQNLAKEGFKIYELDSGYLGWIEYINSKN